MPPNQAHGQSTEHEASTPPTTMKATQRQLDVSASKDTKQIPHDEPTPPLDNMANITPTTEETIVLPPFEDILDIFEEIECTVEFHHDSFSTLHFHFDFGVRHAKALSHGCAKCYPWDKRDTMWNKSKDTSR